MVFYEINFTGDMIHGMRHPSLFDIFAKIKVLPDITMIEIFVCRIMIGHINIASDSRAENTMNIAFTSGFSK
jgi:hypothetical protein